MKENVEVSGIFSGESAGQTRIKIYYVAPPPAALKYELRGHRMANYGDHRAAIYRLRGNVAREGHGKARKRSVKANESLAPPIIPVIVVAFRIPRFMPISVVRRGQRSRCLTN